MKTGAVIVCAGEGKRLGRIDKPTLILGRHPLFFHTLAVFKRIKQIRQIVLVLRKKDFPLAGKLIKDKRVIIVEGGKERKESVYNGLCALDKDIDYVLIHDGVRPFLTVKAILRLLNELRKYNAVVCGVESRDALKLVKEGFVKRTLNRDNIFSVQTPQGFKKSLILNAYKKYTGKKVFDDAQLIEAMGRKVKVIKGDISNFKITYPEDVFLAKTILGCRGKRVGR